MKERDPKNIIAGIDIGTNSARLMVVDVSDGKIIGQELITTKLGESLAFSDKIPFQAMNRTFVALSELKRIALEEYNVSRIRAFCTEALRKARNRSEFIERVEKNLDIRLELIGGVREAEYVFKGIYFNRKISLNLQNSLIVDIGGGSTEFIYIKDSNIEFMKSIDIGALILTERYFESDPPRAEEFNNMEDEIIGKIGFLEEIKDCKLIGLGGSITTLSALNMNLRTYRADNVDGSKITLRRCKKLLWDLRSVPLEERKNIISFDNDRAEIIVAGATILVNIMEKVLARSVTVSETGILYGYIMEEYNGTSDR
jgi:exopolyphosphatase/guanosine-5'-triphosphate,3'-diphosphate pyrophosphatase